MSWKWVEEKAKTDNSVSSKITNDWVISSFSIVWLIMLIASIFIYFS